MFASMHVPKKLSPDELDEYLARGWFRMRQSIFTTNFLFFKNQFYSAIWLRVALKNYIPDKRHRTLLKLNQGFRVLVQKAKISQQQEELYSLYRESIAFEPSESLQELLYGNARTSDNIFDTYEVNVFDGDTLIGIGYFDKGATCAEGISSFYHPAYRKYSVGKYIMFAKIDYCRQLGLRYFYPGYLVPNYPPFEYKREIGRPTLEFLALSNEKWLPIDKLNSDFIPIEIMKEKLLTLKSELLEYNVPAHFVHYRFFEANLDPSYNGSGVFDFPVFLHCFPTADLDFFWIVVFDVRDQQYHLLQCSSIFKISFIEIVESIFSSHLLRVDIRLLSSKVPTEILDKLLKYM